MKKSKRFIIPAIAVLIIIAITAAIVFLPINSVNVIFNRCINSDELATVFQNTFFKSYQYYSVDGDSANLTMTNNSQLFGIPLEGEELEEALKADLKNAGIIVLDGNASMIDIAKIRKSPFVDDIVIYYPIFDGGDRDILPESSTAFFEKHPESFS